MPIVYCLVARGVVVECDVSHPLHSGNFKLVALKLLNKVNQQYDTAANITIPPPPTATNTTTPTLTPSPHPSPGSSGAVKRQTLLFDAHTFNFLSVGRVHCLALCTADVKQHTAFLFLADVMETYTRAAAAAGQHSGGRLDGQHIKAITDALHNKMEQYNSTAAAAADADSSSTSQRAAAGQTDDKQPHRAHKDRREKEKSGKHGGKSNKRPTFSSTSPSSSSTAAPGAEDNPDAVHNVKRELEVSATCDSAHHTTCTTTRLVRQTAVTHTACMASLCALLVECEGHAPWQHRPRAESR